MRWIRAMLESRPPVERYAWYPWNTDTHLFDVGALTVLGAAFVAAFVAAPQYR